MTAFRTFLAMFFVALLCYTVLVGGMLFLSAYLFFVSFRVNGNIELLLMGEGRNPSSV